MKTLKGYSYSSKCNYFIYFVNGYEFEISGELAYNGKRKRFEHVHEGPRGGKILVYWTEKQKEY